MMGNPMINNRVQWIDSLKGICIILVILHHASLTVYYMFDIKQLKGLEGLIQSINYLSQNARLSTFFFASGLTLSFIRKPKMYWFFNKRLTTMLWMIFVWTLFSYFFELIGFHLYPWSAHPYFKEFPYFITPYGNLWFIYSILFLSLVVVLMDSFRRIFLILSTIIIFIMLHLFILNHIFEDNINSILFKNTCYKGIFFFITGYAFSSFFLKKSQDKNFVILMSTLSILLIFGFNDHFNEGSFILMLKYMLFVVFTISFTILIVKINAIKRLLNFVGVYSLEIFITHQFIISLFYSIFKLFELSFVHSENRLLFLSVSLVCSILTPRIFPLNFRKILFNFPFQKNTFRQH